VAWRTQPLQGVGMRADTARRSACATLTLEPELGGQHHLASGNQGALEGAVGAGGRRNGAVDPTQTAAGDVRQRVGKMRVVQNVIGAGADDNLNPLGNGEVLIQGRVDVKVAGAEDRVSADVAEVRFRTRGQEIRRREARRIAVDGGGSAGMRNASDGGGQNGCARADGTFADIAASTLSVMLSGTPVRR